jgi:hypothetical protein
MTLARGLGRLMVYSVPVFVAWLTVYVVTRAYQACKGSDVLPTTTYWEQVASMFLLPVLMYIGIVVLVLRTQLSSLSHRLLQTTAVSLAVAVVFVWVRVRYYHLESASCDGGLPLWWPGWLPAR